MKMKFSLDYDPFDHDEKTEALQHIAGPMYYQALSEFAERVRYKYKHVDLTEECYKIKEEIMDIFREILTDRNIQL